MAARKCQKSFFGRNAMREVGFQQPLDGLRSILGLEIVINLLPDIGVRTKAAAGEPMITLDGLAILADIHLRGDQSDIADVMLRAGMMTAGDVDVEWRIHNDARLAPVADLGCMKFCVRRRKPASSIAGAGNQPGANLRGLDRQADLPDRGDRKLDVLV